MYWTTDDIRRQEDAVRTQLQQKLRVAHEPVSPHTILSQWTFDDTGAEEVSSQAIRYALWNLLEEGVVELTPTRMIVWTGARRTGSKKRTK